MKLGAKQLKYLGLITSLPRSSDSEYYNTKRGRSRGGITLGQKVYVETSLVTLDIIGTTIRLENL